MISFGSDPEFMLENQQGVLKSAIGVVKGSKEKRLKLGKDHQAYYDNVLAECSIKPGKSKQEVIANFKNCFQLYSKLVSPLRMTIRASAEYPEAELQHEEALRFGCDPEFCAYRLCVIEPPEVPGFFRSAGGHVHVGYEGGVKSEDEAKDLEITWNKVWIVRTMDLFLGIPSLLIDCNPASVNRRKLYGNAGSHRLCNAYGVEYRSLSNFWLASPALVEMVFDITEFCAKSVLQDQLHLQLWDKAYSSLEIFKTINEGNIEVAKKTFMPIVKKHLPKKIMDVVEKQVANKKVYNFYQEWNLEL